METEAGVANDEFVDNTADLEPSDEEDGATAARRSTVDVRYTGASRPQATDAERPHRSRCVSAEQETRAGHVGGH